MAVTYGIKKQPPPSRLRPPRRRTAVSLLAAVLLATGMGASACKQKTPTLSSEKQADAGIHKTYERGPVRCDLDLDRSEITIAERLQLSISVTIDEAYEVELPPAGEKLAGFGIVDYRTMPPEWAENNKKKIRRSYVLEPFLSGEYTIPAMTVRFWKSGEEKTHSIDTEEIRIQVTSLLPDTLKNMELHDIRPPVSLPRSMALWIWASAIGGGLLLVLLLCAYLYQRRRNALETDAEPYLPPHEIAYAALERLVSKNLIEKGEIKPFYQEISGILRRYIENRFGIHAPEQTTEEFLEGLKSDTRLPSYHQELLKNFLTHCDLVKFAAHQPSTPDIQNTFNSCKLFIEETKQAQTAAKESEP
jgi:hypothetical protein